MKCSFPLRTDASGANREASTVVLTALRICYQSIRTISALVFVVGASELFAAPQLSPKPAFTSVEAEARYVEVGPERIATEQLTVKFAIVGQRKTTFVVELYVEPNSTGERAQLVQSTTIVTSGKSSDAVGAVNGHLLVGARFSEIRSLAPLPNVGKGEGWAVRIVLLQEKRQVADSGYFWVRYSGKE